ncbi:MAG TPA: 6,7-dimethyl-8-ribityllumazine synthase [Solirubrobacterales bacterium]|nr:6,7-dimethyl-8-ribityllumazine synthase [Solirubrobacterales bacterium]
MAEGKFAICVGNFYADLAEKLVSGAKSEFAKDGVVDIEVFEVPGAFELPLAAHYCATSGEYAGVACLGAVIRGETDHYDFVCNEAARGIQNVQLETGIPCGFGVLTVDNMEQALARADVGGKRDSGANAARAVLRMHQMKGQLGV